MKKALSICLALILAQVASIAFGAQSRSGVVTLTVDLSAHASGQDARLWLPYPVTDAHQIISDISVTGDYESSGVYTDSAFGTPILYARWPEGVKSRTLTLSFAVDRQEIRQTGFPEVEPAWNPADYAEYLQPTSLGPIDGEVKTLADSITKNKRTKTKEYREFFWGGIDPYRVVIAQGRDVKLNPRQAGPALNTFGYPYAEIGGRELDFYNPNEFVYSYTFKEK